MLKKVDNIIFTNTIDEISQTLFEKTNKYCLIACMEGKMQLTRGEEGISIEKNEMAILRTEVFSGNFMRSPDFNGYLLSIDDKMVKELMLEICMVEPRWWEVTKELKSNPVFKLDSEKHRRLLLTYFDLLLQYMEGNQTEYRKKTYMLLARAASFEVLAFITKTLNISGGGDAYSATDRLVKSFIEDLKSDDGTHREVAWYAQRLNITPKYLSHVCKEKLRMTASGVIQDITCERIKYYLLRTDLNIKEIAFKLQFPTVSFFCKYVRQHLGASPLELRRKGNY